VEVARANGIKIAYDRAGEGPPLVLVHGAGVDGRMWQPQLMALADEFTVVAWDEPGAGRSDDLPAGFGLADYAHCLAAVIDALALGPAHVAGLSWGGTRPRGDPGRRSRQQSRAARPVQRRPAHVLPRSPIASRVNRAAFVSGASRAKKHFACQPSCLPTAGLGRKALAACAPEPGGLDDPVSGVVADRPQRARAAVHAVVVGRDGLDVHGDR